jgi:hypothetical protein
MIDLDYSSAIHRLSSAFGEKLVSDEVEIQNERPTSHKSLKSSNLKANTRGHSSHGSRLKLLN